MDPLHVEIEGEAEYLRGRLATATSDAAVLRDQIHRRTQLLDELRAAYIRDVVVMKDRLWKHGIRTDAELHALPSADVKPLLPLFSPAESLLRIRPCATCGGGADLIRCNEEAWMKAEMAAQVAMQQLATMKAAKDNVDEALATMTEDAATFRRMLAKEQKLTAFLQDEKKRLKGKLDAMAARATHHATTESTVVHLETMVAKLQTAAAAADMAVSQLKAELTQTQAEHAIAMQTAAAAAAAELETQWKDWQRKFDRCEERQVKAGQVIQSLERDVERFENAAAEIETRVELRHMQDLNALSLKWQREVDAHAATKQRMTNAMADLEQRLQDAVVALLPAQEQLAATRQQLDERTRERDASMAQYTTLDDLFRTKTKLWQTKYDEMDGQWRSTVKLTTWRSVRWRVHLQAILKQYAAWCLWLQHVIRQSKAVWRQQRAKMEGLLSDQQDAYRRLERSMQSYEDQRREARELARSLEDKLRIATDTLKQRTLEHAMANRNVVRAECTIRQLEVQVQTLTSALESQWEVSGGMLMAAEEAAARHIEAGRAWQATYLDARDEWAAETHVWEAKVARLQDDVERARRERHAAEGKTVKFLERLKLTQACLEEKTLECMAIQQEMADVGAELVCLERKLAGEHRRVAMYDDMVDNLTNVLRDQQRRQLENERRISALQQCHGEATAAMDLEWMAATCAATTIQMMWRGWRARRLRPHKKGIYLMETNHVIQTTEDGRRASVRRLHLVRATQSTTVALTELGLVDVPAILAQGATSAGGRARCMKRRASTASTTRLGSTKATASDGPNAIETATTALAAQLIQNAWKSMRLRMERRNIPLGEPGRMALESRIQTLRQQHRRMTDTLRGIGMVCRQQAQLVALKVAFRSNDKSREWRYRSRNIPPLLKYRLQHPLKPTGVVTATGQTTHMVPHERLDSNKQSSTR
ncbi:hypothetical protein, variant 1 [Aphanomyces invadans]|uniref:Uncharacterized protein n=2 Tax=Aphanomyces invadans TaxID=157072 RepID=A0A024TQE0_9STRA|nr:hypothetical protein, variant 1 [Aphanomyces invadans]ETV96350.1 hypothetical protein, variant 1 [Aphanomyces invadans]|eukprot:XP_008875142.1 hypothetical protein, variant 1 [Aphanomyces invadans]